MGDGERSKKERWAWTPKKAMAGLMGGGVVTLGVVATGGIINERELDAALTTHYQAGHAVEWKNLNSVQQKAIDYAVARILREKAEKDKDNSNLPTPEALRATLLKENPHVINAYVQEFIANKRYVDGAQGR